MSRNPPPLVALVALLLFSLAFGLMLPTGATAKAAPAGNPAGSTSRAYLPLIFNDFETLFTPNDPLFGQQWHLAIVNATHAWYLTRGSSSVMIAVLDTGADLTHPDLAGKLHTDLAWNYIDSTNNAQDDNGHGTHVSGLAAAALNNGVGVAGLGGDATIIPLKVMNSAGQGDFYTLDQAIRDAADKGAKVISMSLGSPASANLHCNDDNPDLQAAVDYAYNKGVLLVAAAGNDASSGLVAPADCAHVLGVASTDGNDSSSYFSNYGSYVSVAAPGGANAGSGILSTCDASIDHAQYCYKEGTSMATPLVAGLAALVYARYPSYTPGQVASAILDNSVDLGPAGWDEVYGCGRIDAYAALENGAKSAQPVCVGVNAWAASAGAQAVQRPYQAKPGYLPGELMVHFTAGTSQATAKSLLQKYGASVEEVNASGVWRVKVAPGQEQAVIDTLESQAQVDYARPIYPLKG